MQLLNFGIELRCTQKSKLFLQQQAVDILVQVGTV